MNLFWHFGNRFEQRKVLNTITSTTIKTCNWDEAEMRDFLQLGKKQKRPIIASMCVPTGVVARYRMKEQSKSLPKIKSEWRAESLIMIENCQLIDEKGQKSID